MEFLVFDMIYNGENIGKVMWCPVCGKGSDYALSCPHCGTKNEEAIR